MNSVTACKDDIVRVHDGVTIGDHDLSGLILTVHDNHTSPRTGAQLYELDDHAGQLELTHHTGDTHIFLLPQDVDLVFRAGTVA